MKKQTKIILITTLLLVLVIVDILFILHYSSQQTEVSEDPDVRGLAIDEQSQIKPEHSASATTIFEVNIFKKD